MDEPQQGGKSFSLRFRGSWCTLIGRWRMHVMHIIYFKHWRGLLSVGMGVFLCGYAYRLLTPGSRPTVVKEQPSSPQSSELSTPIAPSEPRQQLLHCPKCSSPYLESDAFCKTCGLTLSTPATQTEPAIETMTCSHCSATIPTKANFCPKCGSAVSHVATTEPKVFVETPAIQKQTRRQQQP